MKRSLTPQNDEEQNFLKQQAKMAAMGEMIGNIAHQWRQPLNALSALNIGLSTKYKAGKLDDAAIEKFKSKSNTILQNMSSTIDDFANFYRPNKEKETFKIDDAIQNALRFVGDTYKQHQVCIVDNTSPNIMIKSYKNELMQVLLNILNNSRDAMVDRGVTRPTVTITTTEENGEITITIQDNAGGVKEEILEKLCEPYFTTKFKSHGTGIGLYMSKMIIEESMGGLFYIKNSANGLLTTIRLKKEHHSWAYSI